MWLYTLKKQKPKQNPLFSARRDNAPVSVAAPATTEKHQETTTQLNTPSLFNYCHIITAIYLHLLHRHQTQTHTLTGVTQSWDNTHAYIWTRPDLRASVWSVRFSLWDLLASGPEKEMWDDGREQFLFTADVGQHAKQLALHDLTLTWDRWRSWHVSETLYDLLNKICVNLATRLDAADQQSCYFHGEYRSLDWCKVVMQELPVRGWWMRLFS